MDIVSIILLVVFLLTIFALYKVIKKFNKSLEPQKLKEETVEIKTFKDYLKGKDISFWNTFSLPRWTYLFIPVAISGKNGDLFGIIVGEILLLVALYILYLFYKRKRQINNKLRIERS